MAMRKSLRYSLMALVAAVCLCSCGRDAKIIPRNKMSKIYAEMYLTDAWLLTAPEEARLRADTTSLYEPILEKYGYTLEDYWASVSHYLQDPERFSRILKKSEDILESGYKSVKKEMEAVAVNDTLPKRQLEKR